MKTCKKCGETKPLAMYSPRKDSTDGHNHQCRACISSKTRARQKTNPEKVKAAKQRYYATPKGKAQKAKEDAAFVASGKRAAVEARRAEKPVSAARKEARKRWAKANTVYRHAQTLKRRAEVRRLSAFDFWVLQEAVSLARQREALVGGKWHVDHVQPVAKGGTSEHHNIQVVPAAWNRRKSDKHANRLFGA
jgi:hypothetical protein